MGKRADVVLIIGAAIFVLEFKVGEKQFTIAGLDQVCDYALDLKNFHETSHSRLVAPILIPTEATGIVSTICPTPHDDKLLYPIRCSVDALRGLIASVLLYAHNESNIDPTEWEQGRYSPTPTIIEAALALYNGHSVSEISRNDATAINLAVTSASVSQVIHESKTKGFKSICFVTGVPGAGKTLVGLNIATEHRNEDDTFHSVFLSGNGPLVAILREALARDHVQQAKERGQRIRKGEALSKVSAFIQNVHHFRDDCLSDPGPPFEHVAIFDEAQRAWDLAKTSDFVRRRNGTADFNQSEPEFLISCLDRHDDWAVIVCLVGGGQEINTGEAGITEWIHSLQRSFPKWHVYISSRLTDSEYAAGRALKEIASHANVVERTSYTFLFRCGHFAPRMSPIS